MLENDPEVSKMINISFHDNQESQAAEWEVCSNRSIILNQNNYSSTNKSRSNPNNTNLNDTDRNFGLEGTQTKLLDSSIARESNTNNESFFVESVAPDEPGVNDSLRNPEDDSSSSSGSIVSFHTDQFTQNTTKWH